MKKIFWLVAVLVLNCQTAFAGNDLLNYTRWECATVDYVQRELANGANINAKDENGKTALMKAISYSSPEVVKLLIDAGADVNAVDNRGKTALILAATQCSYPVTKFLIEAGAKVNAKDYKGETAWYKAASYLDGKGCPKIEKLLEEAGAEAQRMKISVKKTGEKAKNLMAGIIVYPIVYTGAAIYSITHDTSFANGVLCMATLGTFCIK